MEIASVFYSCLRLEVLEGNPLLPDEEQRLLRDHYPVMADSVYYPPALAQAIYVRRRRHPVRSILNTEAPFVYDAGCGFGSESFLFASLGAKVLGVDRSSQQISIAGKRKAYYEELFDRKLDIEFVTGDVTESVPVEGNLSLTWMASVFAAVTDQDSLFRKIHDATRSGGEIMVSDMNLMNPLFLAGEWRRRRAAMCKSRAFREQADFAVMFRRRGRNGARYYPMDEGEGEFDDVQFFSASTLQRLMKETGFFPCMVDHSGFVPPMLARMGLAGLEYVIPHVPLLRNLGYFYIVSGRKSGG